MRYLGLAEAFVIAEAVTGLDAHDLVHVSRSDLLDSALHAPQAGFGDTDFYPSLIEKAAVLCVRIAKNHPLPDGNKRLAWMAMVVFLEINDSILEVGEDDAVETMLSVAAGETDEATLTAWLSRRLIHDHTSE
ncbi:MAG: type II toxin-antitoxin system death-on-curing family toxin [Ilumatobacteraceae bacterium]